MAMSYDGAEDDDDVDPLQTAQSVSRTSMSSASATHESSSYSTPATSAVTTPAPMKDETSMYDGLAFFTLIFFLEFMAYHPQYNANPK
jgi:hypothetical protein